jgi:pimeloyl-ACP methyl ester carboxylesterase
MKPFLAPISIILVLLSAILVSYIAVPQKTPLWSSGYASAKDGTSIFYTTSGKGRTALVFVHGWTCDHTYWRKQLNHFAQNYQVVALDLAGHGKSGSNRKAYTMTRFGDDVAAVMEKLKLNQVVLIGHSMGGPTIVEAARQKPEKVIGLVGVDTFQDLEQHLTAEQIDKMLEPVRANYTGAVRYIVRTTMFVPGSDSLLAEQITTQMSSARPETGIDAVRNLFEWKGEEAFNALSIPKWTINSDYQKTNTQVAAKYGLQVELMSGVGHFVMLEDAQTFNKLLSGIITQMERK